MALVPDPMNPGWVRGYAVRTLPPASNVISFHPTRGEAEAAGKAGGQEHTIDFGSHRLGTDDFMQGMSEIRVESGPNGGRLAR